MKLNFSGFQWDTGNSRKCEKHGVSRREIEDLLTAGHFLISPDEWHSQEERRFCAIGRPAKSARHLFVIFTIREVCGDTLIRPISARYMHKQEIARYEEVLAEAEK